ncbi:ABC transporter substrate-binding protein [Streptomyces marispadix]|uniref:ABC transporter substrate-binding protein n=1 Tax=Streptomyces marispadix TaxID=2922868 RepID=A0ABS9T3S5_9ACTN|nr:ABC transporter substrate-binding protein [Streptomyces marispadix]MCH6163162.1 ABC transporter substrate-binding protein [Streptomyces marispadix]
MASLIPPLPKIETLIDALEQLIKLPPGRRGPSPLVMLSQPDDAREAELIADGLCARLRVGGRARVPYAQVAGAPSGPRSERIGDLFQKLEQELERNRPGGFGKLRLPRFTLMCSVVETDLAERQNAVQARELRDRCFAERRKDSNFLKALEKVSGGDQAPTGIPAFLWYWTRQPLFNVLPRWLYGRLQERRMTHKGSWYRQWTDLPKGTGFFQDASRFAGTAPVLGPEAGVLAGLADAMAEEQETAQEREERLDRTTGLLLRALLEDLEAAFRRPRLSPWGRRRKSRFVIVLPQAGEYPEWRERLLAEFPGAVEETGSTSVVLVCTERSGDFGGERAESFTEAAITLRSWKEMSGRGGARVVRVRVEGEPNDAAATRWLGRNPEIYPERIYSDGAPLAEAALSTVLVLALLGGAGVWGVNKVLDDTSTRCIGPAVAKAGTPQAGRVRNDWEPYEVYKESLDLLKENNRAAERAEKQGAIVRTVVYLGVPVEPDSGDEAMYSGAIPELRGVALAQRELNGEAARDADNKVRLKVERLDAGDRFSKAPAVARELVDEMRSQKPEKREEILGVVGLGQSRQDTMEARDILGDAGLPMLGTVATAERMQGHKYYRQVAPDNRREARISADFARHGNIVKTGPETCAPAEKAIVIADPSDEYSSNLSDRFRREFGKRDTRTLWYTPDTDSANRDTGGSDDVNWADSSRDLAEQVCSRLHRKKPRTVVFWAARANEFGAFLNDFDKLTDCDKVHVLGGNDLTNSVVDQQEPSKKHPGARLYYAAHALPASRPRNNGAKVFHNIYLEEFGKDHWSNDGRTALSWDAMYVLSEAVNTALQNSDRTELTRAAVRDNIIEPMKLRGATGWLTFGEGDPVPRDKRLLILHDTPHGAEVSLDCGLWDADKERKKWGTKEEFRCPRDGAP